VFAALTNYERVTSDGFLLSNVVAARGRRRSCPSSRPTPTVPATGTPSWVSPNVPLGVPFATPRADNIASRSNVALAIHPATTFNGFLRAGRRKKPRRYATRQKSFTARLCVGLPIVRADSFHSAAAPRDYCAKLSALTLRYKI